MIVPTILTAAVVFSIFAAICWRGWRNRRAGKGACGGNCSSCGGCCH